MRSINKMINLKGRRALLTGSNGYLGAYIAKTIAELGGDLVLVDSPGEVNNELLSYLKNNFKVDFDFFECDLENFDDRKNLISIVSNQNKPLNILINNAAFVGTSELEGWSAPLERQSIETWRRALEVNLTASFDLSKGLSPKMIESKFGSIINIGSTYGVIGPDYSLYKDTDMGNPAAYAASKGGLIQITRWLATTLGPQIRVNSISPGGIFRNQPKEFVKRYEDRTPLKRMATEEDIMGAIAYLASDLSSYVTGQNLLVDGGWTTL